MSAPAWSTTPYPGGSPVKVKGFPRPLYPPDVPPGSGHEPSPRGPDVIAYKRAVSRLGRWPWQTFDDGYWTDFAHGSDGPDVADSGVAGFQWQQHLDATGWLGSKTFENLRYAKVPQGLPNAGEPAFDSKAVQLLDEAFELFKGNPPASGSGTVRGAALGRAIGQLGYAESPAGSNRNKFGAWYGMDGAPWCAIFVTWCFELASDGASPAFLKGARYAYCPYIVADARANRGGLVTVADPIPGDLVLYDWEGDTVHDHIGIFEAWKGSGTFTAIEGNTSTSNNSNGGQVMRRERSRSGVLFVRVAEP